MTLPLSKTLDPVDFDQLTEELTVVDEYFASAAPQHPMRRWEYAMALRASQTWWDREASRTADDDQIADVGGAGSPFRSMIESVDDRTRCTVIDPALDPSEPIALADYLYSERRLFPQVVCLSVLEHVDDLDRFCYHLGCLVAPGGLLFLTMDACDADGSDGPPPDTYHFHWMRKRIFDDWAYEDLHETFVRQSFSFLGDVDTVWHGAHVYDYSFRSLCLVKRS